ncbi:purine nucleoside permease [Lindgomyces ingoldianus]|uniref:Purine nucleoside permease n=1 Tax=Lindgomyces ingoldianus TaxID=673940 RepID=A0ACB6QR32_9PLEO|nr:purine nucleoside permease [Lindgomyces ingoldianus]KAF2468545.1 purine nucleoside permease [Lindgomyces ingoldianus]
MEAESWSLVPNLNLFAKKFPVPGLSPMYPDVYCSNNGEVCHATTGEGEINAALSTAALLASPLFNLTTTYILVTGISSISPKHGTLGSVTLPLYSIQFSLVHELSALQTPANFSSNYIPLGAKAPDQYPVYLFGTEVFELNDALRKEVASYAKRAYLNDSDSAIFYRSLYYSKNGEYTPGAAPPGIELCDSITSDTWYSGSKIGEAIEGYVKLVTNNHGVYCTAAQEDSAILAALFRGTLHVPRLVDFDRVIVLRSGADFDREHWRQEAAQNLLWVDSPGRAPALRNIGIAGGKIVSGILGNWTRVFEKGVKAENYVGDVFGTAGGTPDFGPKKRPGKGEDGKGSMVIGEVL